MIKSHLLFSIEEDKRFVLLGGLCGLNEKPNEIYLDIVISKESDKIEVQPTKRKIFSLNKLVGSVISIFNNSCNVIFSITQLSLFYNLLQIFFLHFLEPLIQP